MSDLKGASEAGGTRRWIKLDTGSLRNFDAVRLGAVTIVDTDSLAVLRDLARLKGWFAVLVALAEAVRHPAHDLVVGNVTRKRLRVPALFGNRSVRAVYGGLKAVQARLLEVRLAAALEADPALAALIYNGSNFPESVLARVATRINRAHLFVEGGFFPDSIQIDPRGVNAANSVPRDPAFYLNTSEDYAADGLPNLTKVRVVKARGAVEITLPQDYIFVAFQVPSDMQVTLHSPWISNMDIFYSEIRAAADRQPSLIFVIKEHPSFPLSVQGNAPPHPRVIFANANVTHDLIENATGIVTLNSTVGLEAILLERPTIILGQACYDIPGLVQNASNRQELDAALSALPDWEFDTRLRRQFLGWLWNRYLVRGSYKVPPADLSAVLEKQLQLLETTSPVNAQLKS